MITLRKLAKSANDDSPSKWLRLGIPIILAVVWLALGGLGGPYFGKIEEVSTNNLTDFLPSSAEATKVQDIATNFRDTNAIPAIVIVESKKDQLSAEELAWGNELQQKLTRVSGVNGQVSPLVPSQDNKAFQIVALIDTSQEIKEMVEEIRAEVKSNAPQQVRTYVAGPAGFAADLTEAFSGIDGLLLIVALVVVLVILLTVYRSPLLPLIVLLTSILALAASVFIVWWLAKWNIVQLNGQVQGILFILVIGAATDYSLLYVSRFREALRHTPTAFNAAVAALKGSLEPILASGGTVIAGLMCLLLSDLNSNKFLGPVSAIGIVMAMMAALTLLPSMLIITGKFAFWPFQPKYKPEAKHQAEGVVGIWAKLANVVDQKPRALWLAVTVILLICAYGVTQFKANGVPQSQIIIGESESRSGQEALARHFPAGSGSPVIIVTDVDSIEPVVAEVEQAEGIASVEAVSNNSPSGTVPLGKNKIPFGPLAAATPAQVDSKVLLQATLQDRPDSIEAESVVQYLRATLPQLDSGALVGGATATDIDTGVASERDRNIIIPMVLLVITLILMLLLRSIVAPIVLVLTTVLSFAATLGVGAIVFNNLWSMPGADPSVPLYAFIFLVALGIDYNIFLMTRVREETIVAGTRLGVKKGLIITGGVITSAGLVLAATFAALSVIPILFLTQIAFLVAFGVLLDTFVVRSILVPAIIRDFGSISWWPSSLRHRP